jgi:hypothetical protein
MIILSQQFNKEMKRSDLRDRTGLTDSEVFTALHELAERGWIEHSGYPGGSSGDTWKITPVGQSVQARSQIRTPPLLFTEPDGTVVLRPSRSPGLVWSLGIVSLLYAFLLWGALAMGWPWAGLLAVVPFTGIWLGLLIAVVAAWRPFTRLTSTALLIRPWYGRIHTIARQSIAHVTWVHVHEPAGRGGTSYLLFLSPQGHCLGKMLTLGIPVDSLKAFVRQLGVPFRDARDPARSPGQLRSEFPSSMAWAAQPMVVALISVGVIILVIIIVIVILAITGVLQPSS